MPVSWWGKTMGSVKSVVTGLSAAIAIMAMTSNGVYAMTILPNEGTATIRDNPMAGMPNLVFPVLFSIFDDANNTDRGITEFNIMSLTSPVVQAILNLERVGNLSVSQTVSVFGYSGNGTIELSDWGDGTSITSFVVNSSVTAIDVDVTAFINSQIDLSSHFVGFNLRSPNNSIEQVLFAPSLAPSASPTLTITDAQVVLPEPGTLAILGLGLLGLGLVRRRRR